MATIRPNQKKLTAAQKTKYKSALTTLITNGTYGKLVKIHSERKHKMHSSNMMGGIDPVGEQRFLPWHRDFLLQLERALQTLDSSLAIPYWDWTVDRAIPAWLTTFTPTVPMPKGGPIKVTRYSGVSRRNLPLASEIKALNAISTYTDFTAHLEDFHNDVHDFVGGTSSTGQLGTMANIMISPADPIFWMHHAQIDRLWSIWQKTHTGQPNLTGASAILDPWPERATDVNSIATLGYSYA
jgi:tyrosinase